MAQIVLKEFYQSLHMEQPLTPGTYDHAKLEPQVIRSVLEQGKAVWADEPPAGYEDVELGGNSATPDIPDFLDMTVAELKEYATINGVTLPQDLTKKSQMIAFLEAWHAAGGALKAPSEETPPED